MQEKLKVNRWWFHLPVVGTIIYVLRFEFFVNKLVLDQEHPEYKVYRKVKTWKSWSNLGSLLLAIAFLVPFFVLRNRAGFGSWPWFFWVGLSLGLIQNVTPYYSLWLYQKGFKRLTKILSKPENS